MTETILLALILVPCLIIAIVFHEVAHGWTALALGDPTAKEQRRLSLNPIRHVDPVGTLLVPGALALFGGPVFAFSIRRDRPTPDVRKPLRFGEVELAPPQIVYPLLPLALDGEVEIIGTHSLASRSLMAGLTTVSRYTKT